MAPYAPLPEGPEAIANRERCKERRAREALMLGVVPSDEADVRITPATSCTSPWAGATASDRA